MKDTTKVAGKKTIGDWKVMKVKLNSQNVSMRDWEEAYTDFLLSRISSRYIKPIESIGNISEQEGKGFSIVAICCTMIEFFESLLKGYDFDNRNYLDSTGNLIRSTRVISTNGGPNPPLSAKELFVDFLTTNNPFSDSFNSEAIAESFYFQVRCTILHQAATGRDWLIKDGKATDTIIELKSANEYYLKWLPFKNAFLEFLKFNYKPQLINDARIQAYFLLKWDRICGI